MKYLALLLVVVSLMFSACQKDENRKLLNAYFRYTINGSETLINQGSGLNNNTFDCTFSDDSALYINVSKVYEGAGFVIKADSIKDGTYTLDSRNKGYYTNPADQKRYYTTDQYTGTLTIKKGTFQAKDLLYTLQGTFSFQAVDTLTGHHFALTNGSFLMERKGDY
jgi:hypothetical protein